MDMTIRRGMLLIFGAMPLAAGLATLATGALGPTSAATGILVGLSFEARRRGGFGVDLPDRETARGDGVRGWWNSRRRVGFYAAFSVLLMYAFTVARTAVTGTWGGGDLLFAIAMVVPLFVIFRAPPRARTRVNRA